MMRRLIETGTLLAFLAYGAAFAAKDVPALLQQKCGACHGASSGMSGLKVSARETLLKGGNRGPAIVPGKASESLLYKAVAHLGEVSMPPGGALPSGDVAAIKDWIDSGAAWTAGGGTQTSTWWAFRKPVRPAVPAGATNPIDAFIDRKLKSSGIAASPEADRLTLLRRASYDLLGLPPSKEEIDRFLNDKSPDAWEKEIDRLLASPRYGEKWGRHWLDLARYGDTAGFEQDPYLLLAWRYRDYVIKSFNDDKPYDRFVKEQIAADELYPTDPEARTGTGFYRVGTNRDMLFKVEDINLVEKRIDMVDTTGGVFLDYNPARNYDIAENSRDFRLWQTSAEIQSIQRKYQEPLREKKLSELPELVQTAFHTPEEKRTQAQRDLVVQNEGKVRVTPSEISGLMDQADKERMQAIAQRLLQTFSSYGPPPMSAGIPTRRATRCSPDFCRRSAEPTFRKRPCMRLRPAVERRWPNLSQALRI